MQKFLEATYNMTALQAFSVYDMRDTGIVTSADFERVLSIFFGESLSSKAGDTAFVMKLVEDKDGRIEYRDFCKFLDKNFVKSFKHVGSEQKEETVAEKPAGSGKSAVEQELERPLVKEATLNYILRKAADLHIDLRKVFVENDPFELSVLPRVKFWGILIGLPLGMNAEEMKQVFANDLGFDNYGNVDYTNILNMDLFVALEAKRLREKALKQNSKKSMREIAESVTEFKTIDSEAGAKAAMKLADNRKVVVEDLIFVDDLEVLIYTTVSPRTSTIFATSLQKNRVEETGQNPCDDEKPVEFVSPDAIVAREKEAKEPEKERRKAVQQDLLTNHYKLLARFKGHQNKDPPSICFIPQSNCLVSAEKVSENENNKRK
jgi:hypothetical protein